MDNKDEKIQNDLCELLQELARTQDLLKNKTTLESFFDRLEKIYYNPSGKSFRHYYSKIFSTLIEIKQSGDQGNIEILSQNLLYIKDQYLPLNHDRNKSDGNTLIDISDSLKKLYDHVNLDVARISYSDAGDWKLSNEENIKKLNRKIGELEIQLQLEEDKINNLNHTEKKIKKELEQNRRYLNRSVEKVKVDYITILGLFSGIIITFVAGLVFSGSVLENINKGSIYRTVLVILLLALFIFNIMHVCHQYIIEISHSSHSEEPKSPKKKLLFAGWMVTNIIFVTLIILTIVAYFGGWAEKRNSKIQSEQHQIVSSND